jgi:hypothetical protein
MSKVSEDFCNGETGSTRPSTKEGILNMGGDADLHLLS